MSDGSSPRAGHIRRWPPYWALHVVVFVIVVLPFTIGVSSQQTFVTWDDNINVYENPYVTGEKPLGDMWQEWRDPGFYPLYYALLRRQWIGHAWVYKAVSAIVHGVSAVLVVVLAGRLGLGRWTSISAGVLWGVHPMQVATVLWVSEQKNVFCVFFYLAALLLFIDALNGGFSRLRYSGAIILLVAALLVKAIAVTLPVFLLFLLLVRRWRERLAIDRGAWITVGVCFPVAILSGVLHMAREDVQLGPGLMERLLLSARAVWFYVLKFAMPIHLAPVYEQWPATQTWSIGLLSVAGLVGVGIAAYLYRKRLPVWAICAGFFLILNLLLVIGLVWFPYLRFSWVADHLFYLPSIGLALLLAGLMGAIVRKIRCPRFVVAIAGVGLAGVLGMLSWRQGSVWDSGGVFWSEALKSNPRCVPAYANIASMFLSDGRAGGAVDMAKKGLAIDPEDADLWHNLGAGQFQIGRYVDAVQSLLRAVSLGIDMEQSYDVYVTLGQSYGRLGRDEEAAVALGQAIKFSRRPVDAAAASRLLGESFKRMQRYDEAADAFAYAVRYEPEDLVARANFANVLGTAGDIKASVEQLKELLRRRPDDQNTMRQLARILATTPEPSLRDGEEALRLARRLRKLSNDQPVDPMIIEAMALAELGRFAEAIDLLNAARPRAEARGMTGLVNAIDHQLQLYSNHQPIRSESLRQRRIPSRVNEQMASGTAE